MAHSRQFLEGAHLHVHLDDLVEICKDYHSRVFKLEGDKWDLERGVKIRILEVWPQTVFVLLLIYLGLEFP